jgi:hypothetical protein
MYLVKIGGQEASHVTSFYWTDVHPSGRGIPIYSLIYLSAPELSIVTLFTLDCVESVLL